MEENDTKRACAGTKLEFKIEERKNFISKSDMLLNFSFQNLTRRIFFNSKSDALYFFQFRI